MITAKVPKLGRCCELKSVGRLLINLQNSFKTQETVSSAAAVHQLRNENRLKP